MHDSMFSQVDFGELQKYLNDDDVTDISYSNNGQLWLKTLSKGIYRVENSTVDNAFIEKLAFQCANTMGKSFNMAHPFLDAESAELRLNFVHDSIARNGIAVVLRKTPAKIRLQKEKILNDKYITLDIHDFLIKCVLGHCNIIVCGETGSGKTEFVKYLAAHTKEDEKLITIEDTLELHLDRIFPHRDIVTLKTNNIASYSDVLVACMRQNPIWILLSEVRSAEAVTAVRNSISSGHFILSTIHADKSASIPMRMYSLLETSQDVDQFLTTVYRYIQLGVCIRGRQDKATKKFKREIADISEFYVDENNIPKSHLIYRKTIDGRIMRSNPTKYLIDYLDAQGITLPKITESNTIDDEAPELPKGMSFKNVINNPVVGDEKKVVAEPTVNPMGQAPVRPIPEVQVAPTPQPAAPNAAVPNGINSIFAGTQNNG
jgi:pilus assembly protein CpaF